MANRRWTLASIALAAIVVLDAPAALACRCAQKNLSEYYDRADLVLFARALGTRAAGAEVVVAIEPEGEPYKGEWTDGSLLVTASDTAACGIRVADGAHYVMFGERVEGAASKYKISTCNGSRRLPNDSAPQAFRDVPNRFVLAQIAAQHATAILAEVARKEPAPSDATNLEPIGLLDLAPLAHGGFLETYAKPDTADALPTKITEIEQVETREASYEFPAAVVYAKRPGSYRIRFRSGVFVWIKSEGTGTYWPYDELPIRRLAYLNTSWDGYVWPSPGAGLPVRSVKWKPKRGKIEIPIEVHESTRIAGSLWFRITVLSGDPCEGGDAKPTLGGWVPGYGSDGKPAVWFYSRGC